MSTPENDTLFDLAEQLVNVLETHDDAGHAVLPFVAAVVLEINSQDRSEGIDQAVARFIAALRHHVTALASHPSKIASVTSSFRH